MHSYVNSELELPLLAYHGTRAANISSIEQRGLLIPAPIDGSAVDFHHSQGGDVRPSIVNAGFDLNAVSDANGYVYEAPTFWESGGSGIVMVSTTKP